MTPSAARGVLEAIFWEPQIYYLIDSIRVVKRGQWVSFRRNEVISVVSLDSAKNWMKEPGKFAPIQAGGGAQDGTQRNMLALEGVEYIITAEIRLTELGQTSGQKLRKYREEVERRTKQGKCFHRPSLGMREFAADFEWESDPQAALERRAAEICDDKDWRNVWLEEDLGLMLYDVFDHERRSSGFRWRTDQEIRRCESSTDTTTPRLHGGAKKTPREGPLGPYEGVSVEPHAMFFRAHVRHAVMDCHPQRVKVIRKAP
jgi:CRISPR-associated protein Cas5d